MNKKVRWIIIIAVSIVVLTAIIFSIINEVGFHYKVEEISEYNYFILVQNKKYGVIDKNGNTIIDAEYEAVQIPNPSNPVFVCIKGYNQETKEYDTVVYNEKNEVLFPEYKNVQAIAIFTNINSTPYEKSVLTYKENGKYGLINLKGKQITKPIYDEISSINYKEGTFLVKQNELEGIINMKGKVIIKCEYESVNSDNYYNEKGSKQTNNSQPEGFVVSVKTEDGYRYGYINYRGTKIIEPSYTQLSRVTEIINDKNLYFIAFKDGQAGLLKNNKEILNYEYEDIQYNVLSDIFITQRNGKYGAVNREGTVILYPEYSTIYTAGIYLNTTKETGENYIYDLNGNKIETQVVSKSETDNPNYYITIDKNNIYRVVDKDDNIIIDKDYSYIEYLFENYFIVTRDYKTGIIDSNGQSVIELKYDNISKINDMDILRMELDQTVELYSLDMKKIVSMDNAALQTVKENEQYWILYSDTDFKYIHQSGKLATAQEIYPENTLFAKNINGKWGFVDKKGDLKVKNDYELVTDFNKYGFAGIKKDGKWGTINTNGEIVQEPVYELKWSMPEFIGKYYRINAWYGDIRFSNQIEGEKDV